MPEALLPTVGEASSLDIRVWTPLGRHVRSRDPLVLLLMPGSNPCFSIQTLKAPFSKATSPCTNE